MMGLINLYSYKDNGHCSVYLMHGRKAIDSHPSDLNGGET